MISSNQLEDLLKHASDDDLSMAACNASFVREMAKTILAQREHIAQTKTYALQLECILKETG
jgi:hypothetical protein